MGNDLGADIADRLQYGGMRNGAQLEQEQHLVRARFQRTRHIADAVFGIATGVPRHSIIADMLVADGDMFLGQIGDDGVLALQRISLFFGGEVRDAGLGAALIPVRDGFGEKALATQADAARVFAIVQDTGGAEGGEMLGGDDTDLIFHAPGAEILAIDGISSTRPRVTDEYGAEISLSPLGYMVACYPMSMIQKRIAAVERVNLAELRDETIDVIKRRVGQGYYDERKT